MFYKSGLQHAKKHFEPQKVVRDPVFLTVLASESLWCHRVVQTLRASETLAWCKFCGVQLPKELRTCSVVICFAFAPQHDAKLWRHLGQLVFRTRPFLGADLASRRSHKTIWKNTAFRALATRENLFISHISAVSHLRNHISLFTNLGRQLSILHICIFFFYIHKYRILRI